jgi:hypothetical protein
MRAIFRDRRILAGLALGGALAASIVLVWNRVSYEGVANARGSDPIASKPDPAPPARTVRAEPEPDPSSAPKAGFARYEDYFSQNYFATYFYASPAYAAADWGRAAPSSAPSPPPSAFTLPSLGELLEPAKLLPNAPLAVPPPGALADVSKFAPAASVSIPAPSSPVGLLTNNTPFHLFVTSDPVSAASSTASEAPSVVSSGAGSVSSAGGAAGAVSGTVGSVTGTAGSLLHK